MKVEIDEHVINNTIKCLWDYACLSNNNDNNHKICEINNKEYSGVVFIKYREEIKECNYSERFGSSSYLCTCPVRKEIYRKYKH